MNSVVHLLGGGGEVILPKLFEGKNIKRLMKKGRLKGKRSKAKMRGNKKNLIW
jgi:hypothetical protein